MGYFAEALAVVNSRLPEILSPNTLSACCQATGHKWRNSGPLRPWTLFMFCILQTLKGNTACAGVSMMGGRKFSAEAFCKARKRLPIAVFQMVLEKVAALAGESKPWHGLRVFFADGTGCSMPETPELAKFFGLPSGQKPGLGAPVAHLLHLMDAATGMILKTIISPCATGDLTHFPKLLTEMGTDAVLVCDRGFAVFAAFALCRKHGTHCIMRASRHCLRLEGCGELGPGDRIVVCRHGQPSRIVPQDLWRGIKHCVALREITCRIRWDDGREMELLLLTSLLDPAKHPAKDIIDLYLRRWEIEVNFRHLKRTLTLEVLKGKGVDVVKKEILMHAIAYNLVRQVMVAGGKQMGVCPTRIGFKDALRWLLDCQDPAALERLIVNPTRARSEPRVVKRRPKIFPLMTKPRHQYPRSCSAKIVKLGA